MARLSDKLAQHARPSVAPNSVAPDAVAPRAVSLAAQRDTLTELPLAQIESDPEQPRKDLGDLTELAASIKELGLVQPIIVSIRGFERYRILAGERRYSAAKLAGLSAIPAIVRSVEEHERLQLQIIENLHRKDLTPFEEARAYQALADQFGFKQEDIARRLGRSQESVSEMLRLLSLPEKIQTEFEETSPEAKNRITRSLLLEIARRPAGERAQLWEQARQGSLTVKQARAYRTSDKRPVKPVRPRQEMTFRYPIHLDGATVTVQFDRASATTEEIIEALEQALTTEKKRLA